MVGNSEHNQNQKNEDHIMENSRAPLMEHLYDLRVCVVRSLIGVLSGAAICFLLFEPIYSLLTTPLYQALEALNLESALKFRTVQGAFLFHFKTSILGGFILGMPVILYQLWLFIAPGLYKKEKKLVIPFVAITSIFFFFGVYFCYIFVMPVAFEFFLSYTLQMDGRKLLPDITLEDYLSTFTKIIMAFGIVFETPIFLGFLTWIELITHTTLIYYWRWAVVGSFVIAALLTPPDYITQSLLALPLIFFYGLSIIIAWYITKRKEHQLKS
jgi:sec-independent protein translocase protein TatC